MAENAGNSNGISEEEEELLVPQPQNTQKAKEEFMRHKKMAIQCCDVGRKFLENKDYENGSKEFSKTIMTFEYILKNNFNPSLKGQIAALLKQIIVPAYSNLSLCYLKMQKWEMAIRFSNLVLEQDKSNAKNLYRRAMANKMIKYYEQAMRDFEMVRKLDPQMDGQCKKQINQSKELLKKYKEKQKQTAKKLIQGYSSDIPNRLADNLKAFEFSADVQPESFFTKVKSCIKTSISKITNLFKRNA